MQKISELLNIEVRKGKHLDIYHPEFKDKEIYSENSDGWWYKYEYNEEGKVIYLENSEGHWCKWEYNDEGQEIYFENSDGYIEDNRVKKLTVKELEDILGYKLEIISEGE